MAGQAKILLGLATIDEATGKNSDVLLLLLLATALPLSRSANAVPLEADMLRRTGIAYDDFSEPSKALAEYTQALLLYKAAGDAKGQANSPVLRIWNAGSHIVNDEVVPRLGESSENRKHPDLSSPSEGRGS